MRGEIISPVAAQPQATEPSVEIYDDGRLHIEYQGFYVECAGQPFYDLARKEFFLLACLARHAGRVVSHDTLWAAAWSDVQPVNHRTMRAHIVTLRRKLAPFGIEIISVIHFGYRLHTATPSVLTATQTPEALPHISLSSI